MNWALVARRVIAETFAALPADADLQARQKALREAYPFGPREHWPYAVWLKEVKRALAPYKAKAQRDVLPGLGRFGVECPWCGGPQVVGGCLACCTLRTEYASRQVQERWAAARGDPGLQAVLSDWCEETGRPAVAEAIRRRLREGKRC